MTFKTDEADLEVVNTTLRSGIWRVTHVLNFLNGIDNQQINVRALYEEIQDLRNIPCRLVSDQGSLEPIEFVSNINFDNIEENFTLKKLPGLEYSLLPIEDWKCQEELEWNERKSVTPSSREQKLEGGKAKIIVTHLNNLDSFYVQKYSVQTSLRNMNKHIERKMKRKLTSEDIVIGHIYGVKYEIKNIIRWRRGKLMDIIKNDPNKILCSVFFVDYGNTQCVTVDRLRELDYHIIKRLPYAFECKLTNPDNVTFDTNAHLHLPQIIGEKELYLQYTNKQSDGVLEVDLLVPTSNGNAVSVRDILLKTSSIPEKEEIFFTKQLKLFKNSKRFTLGQEELVVISYLKDPFHICVQLVQNIEVLNKMKHEMTIFYEHRRSISCVPVENTNVVVKYQHESQGNWHRGRIMDVNIASQNVDVYFVDWGGSATVPWSNIRLLTEQFTKVECQAIIVKLTDIQQTSVDEPWPQEAIDFLQEQVLIESRFKMVVNSVNPFEVALFQIRPSADICINSLLVERNFAISTGNISKTLYWPNENYVEDEDDDDDELSFQLIKKSEEVIVENEDFDLKNGIRQQVSVVHFESPDLIFIKFSKYKAVEDEMNKELQIHYSTRRKNKDVWEPSEYCIIYDSIKSKYMRGVIKSAAGPDAYMVYLYDHVQEMKVPQKLIFIQDPYFKRFVCYVYKCRLANIKPAGDRGKWSRLAIEILQKIFSTYKILHIKKTEVNRTERMFGVIMWYSLATPAKALEPSKFNFISINKSLIESGVAFGTASAVNISSDAEKSPDSEKEDEEKLEISNVADDVRNSDSRKHSQNWYEMICEDEELLMSPLTSWPKPLRVQKKEFDAVLTCVDSEGCFSIRDEDMQSIYLDLEANLNSKFSSLQLPQESVNWRPSEMCTILYENSWYRGTVISILEPPEISVEMIDFGSEHVVNQNQLYKHIMFPDMPPLVNKIQLYDVYSEHGSWSGKDVDELLKIVSDNIKVIIKSDLDCELPLAEIYLESGLSVNDIITQTCPHLRRYKNKVALANIDDEECKNEVTANEEELPELGNESVEGKETESNDIVNTLSYTYAPLSKPLKNKIKMFVVNVLKWGSEYKAVLNIVNNEIGINSEDFVTLSDEIQENVADQPTLDEIEINEPCVCFHPQNSTWCRAIIYNVDSLEFGYVLAFFVDYGTIDMVTTDNLKVMRPEWFKLPVYNRVAIIDIELIQSSRAEHVLMQMNNLRGKSATVEIVSEEPFKVHLYDGKNLCYQNFINCGILRAL
ncbi:RING finger protein 17 [Asbolus verrucosus]|uniref:RING finger protein 17 n=1 Tax=Asbolus verrucosus TaxID=1661398 RepID=A0A482VT35_ASBVE|nr:RING finger protein 17 [Asbolus verrucosus]